MFGFKSIVNIIFSLFCACLTPVMAERERDEEEGASGPYHCLQQEIMTDEE